MTVDHCGWVAVCADKNVKPTAAAAAADGGSGIVNAVITEWRKGDKPRGISGTASAGQDRPPANAGGMGWVKVKRGSLVDHVGRSLVVNEGLMRIVGNG